MDGSGSKRHGPIVWPHADCLARGFHGMALRLRPDGRNSDRGQPRRRSTQFGVDGSKRSDPRGDRAGAISNVERNSLTDCPVMDGIDFHLKSESC